MEEDIEKAFEPAAALTNSKKYIEAREYLNVTLAKYSWHKSARLYHDVGMNALTLLESNDIANKAFQLHKDGKYANSNETFLAYRKYIELNLEVLGVSQEKYKTYVKGIRDSLSPYEEGMLDKKALGELGHKWTDLASKNFDEENTVVAMMRYAQSFAMTELNEWMLQHPDKRSNTALDEI